MTHTSFHESRAHINHSEKDLFPALYMTPSNPSPALADAGETLIKLAAELPPCNQFPWYQDDIGSRLTPECRGLLVEYSRIPPADVERHVYRMRDIAWSIFPFPCIGEFWFLTLGLSSHPRYDSLLTRINSGRAYGGNDAAKHEAKLMDIGTCFGQDLRKLVHDGASPCQLIGVDVFSAFEKIGQDFFCDQDRFITGENFKTADIFAPISSLGNYQRSQDVVTSTMFLHSFDWDTQVHACKQMVAVARGKGSWLMGGISGSMEAGEHWLKPPMIPVGAKKHVFRHDRDSMIRMWQQVGKEVNLNLLIWVDYEKEQTEARRAVENGGSNFFDGLEVKLLWYHVEIL